MTCDSRKFFQLFFQELEQRGIPFVILHSYQEMPEKIPSDIDYAVPDDTLPKLRKIQSELAHKNGWLLVQTSQPGLFAFDAVLVNLETPTEILKLRARSDMKSPNRFGPALLCREYARVVKQIFRPTGVCLAVLGSDGAGKSTLLARLKILLEPCFSDQVHFHFRPKILKKRTHDDQEAIATPHGHTPKNSVASWFRVIYYFADFWAGWLLLIFPARIRDTLVIFDRDFDDLLIDERRYRLKGTKPLVGILRHFMPHPRRTFILSGPATLLHQRKPELPVEELERQNLILQTLAKSSKKYFFVSVDQSPDEVAYAVWRAVLSDLAEREEKRN